MFQKLPMLTRSRVAWYVLLFLLVISLATNIYIMTLALDLQERISRSTVTAALALDTAVRQMEALETQSFTVNVPINEEIPIDATIPFDEEFMIPVRTTVPIDTNVEVPVDLGVFGPLDLSIPIETEVPLDLTVPVRIQRDVPIRTTVPVQLDVPVTLSLRGTEMAEQLEGWRAILVDLRDNLD